jgi:hypothetical protein
MSRYRTSRTRYVKRPIDPDLDVIQKPELRRHPTPTVPMPGTYAIRKLTSRNEIKGGPWPGYVQDLDRIRKAGGDRNGSRTRLALSSRLRC